MISSLDRPRHDSNSAGAALSTQWEHDAHTDPQSIDVSSVPDHAAPIHLGSEREVGPRGHVETEAGLNGKLARLCAAALNAQQYLGEGRELSIAFAGTAGRQSSC
ncbi:MAG: hypothetical protein FJW27_12320 [Acidimicrobiia bacterium]|nr:hypothetical protein [Acidimicrobiia bacterium]